MLSTRYTAPLLVLLTALFIAGCAAGDEVAWKEGDAYLLQFMPEPGQAFAVQERVVQETSTQVMNQEIDQTQETTREYRYDVRGIDDDGTVDLEVTTTRMAMDMQTPGGQQQFDSDDERVPPLFRPSTAMVGQPFGVHVRPHGAIDRVGGVEDLMSVAEERVEELPNPEQAEAMMSQLESSVGEEALLENLRAGFGPLREGSIAEGDSWTDDYTMSIMMPLDVSTTYTLERVDEDEQTAHLSLDGTLTADDADLEMAGAAMDLSVEGTQTGTMTLHLPTGMVQTADMEVEAEGSGSMDVPEEAAAQIDADQLDVAISTASTTEITTQEVE